MLLGISQDAGYFPQKMYFHFYAINLIGNIHMPATEAENSGRAKQILRGASET